jgi:hypothetical protein
VDVINSSIEKNNMESNEHYPLTIDFIDEGNKLKKDQLDKLIEDDFNNLYQEYQSNPGLVKATIKKSRKIERITSKKYALFLT